MEKVGEVGEQRLTLSARTATTRAGLRCTYGCKIGEKTTLLTGSWNDHHRPKNQLGLATGIPVRASAAGYGADAGRIGYEYEDTLCGDVAVWY